MKAFIFPGQGAQFPGMAKEYWDMAESRELFEEANQEIGFSLTDIMFSGTEEQLKQTNVTQPAIFLHSVVKARAMKDAFNPDMVAGHSLGEISALVAAGALSFIEGLKLVIVRADAMQKACELEPSTMAAVLGLGDEIVEEICAGIPEVVVPANYNFPGQLVISGSIAGINIASEQLLAAGAKRVVILNVGGAFHSPLMEPAKKELSVAIMAASFKSPVCPIFQNFDARPHTNPDEIRKNLIDQLTGSVRWSQSVRAMIDAGATSFTEVGPGNVLQGLVKKIDRAMITGS